MINMLRLVVASAFGLLIAFGSPAQASPNGIVISQVYGGGGNTGATYRNDYIEIFNGGSAAVSLAGWSVQYASSAGTSWAATPLTPVTLAPGQYYLVQEAVGAGGTTVLPAPDATGSIALSATAGKVALVTTTTALTGSAPTDTRIVDVVGFGGANFFEGSGPTAAPSNTTAVLRKTSGCVDTDDNASDFAVGAPTPRNTAAATNKCGVTTNAPIVTTCPSFLVAVGTSGSGNVSATDADGTVNAVALTGQPAGITLGTFTPATAPGGVATVPILVAAAVPVGSYPVTVTWGNDQSQTAVCNPTITIGAVTAIYTIQGSGSTSTFAGRTVITQGVVTKVQNNSFFMQDPVGDGDPATSDGLLVFTSTAPTVVAGDLVRVSATVTEFNVGAASNTDTASHTVTELSSVSSVTKVGTGTVTPTSIPFPLASRDDLERYEGMLITITGPLTVSQNEFVGRYGQVTLTALGRAETPTNRFRPGPSALALDADNRRRSIILDDGTSLVNPNPTPYLGEASTLRDGDTLSSLTGVLDYGLATSSNADPGSWRISPTATPVFTRVNARTTAPEEVGGTVKVASANVLNFFTTFTNGQTAGGATGQGCSLGSSISAGNCRGADNVTEFIRQRTKIIEALAAIGADAVGLMELQNNGPTAIQNIVDALNAKLGAGTYEAVSDPAPGTGTDAIKVGMIYRPARLTRVGASVSDPNPVHNRPPLAQTFQTPGGQTFTLVVNHLKSKSSCTSVTGGDADNGDLQGCFNATRVLQAQATRAFVTSLFPAGSTNNVLLVGDFNAYAQEDPVIDITTNGYTDEIGRFNSFGYSYVFDGAAGRLDHAFASSSLSPKVTRALEWHINADEPSILDYNLENKQPACATCSPDFYTPTPYRASDHDPLVIGINFAGGGGRGGLCGMPGITCSPQPTPAPPGLSGGSALRAPVAPLAAPLR